MDGLGWPELFSLPLQSVVPWPTVNILLLPPLAHCWLLPIPATRMKRVPLARSIVQFMYVTPRDVHVVGRSDRLDSGRYCAIFESRAYVIGMLKLFPIGMIPNMVGGVVVLPL